MRCNLSIIVMLSICIAWRVACKEMIQNNICVDNKCNNLLSTEIFTATNLIKTQQQQCTANCTNLDFECIQSCIQSLYNGKTESTRVVQCFQAKCFTNTFIDNILHLKQLLTTAVSAGECTAKLRNQCEPYIDVYECPRRCLQNWVPTECSPCTYDFC